MDKNIKNGGFPPLKYCDKNKTSTNTSNERAFAGNINNNINIRQLINNNIKPIIISKENDELEIVNNF